ncbi:MAG: ScyD/ScyE family protein [Candidatus Promineifilaceae bacterium]|nr:ScyD/ScyE family protein [Candidatus Promineifilaceae bacterium]
MSNWFAKRIARFIVGLMMLSSLILAACSPQEVEVTRVVEEVVEQEVQVEVTRVVEQEVEVEVPVEVEVTRIVEVAEQVTPVPEEEAEEAEEEEPAGPPPFEPPTAVIAEGLRSPRQLFYADDGTLYIAEAGTAGDSAVMADPETTISTGLTGQITAVTADGEQSVVLPALPSINQGADDAGYRGSQGIYVTDDSYWISVGEGPASLFGLTLFYNVYEIDRETWRIKQIIDTAQAATEAGQPDADAINSDPVDIDVAEDGTVYIADAGCNCLWSWQEESGLTPFHLWDIEDNPVPTGVSVAPDGSIFVSFLSGFPFEVGGTRIEQYSGSGELLQTYEGLTLVTDVLVADDGTIYAVEMAAGLGDRGFIPDSGRVITVSEEGITPVLEGLRVPYGLAQAPDGSLVVSVGAAFDPTGSGMVIAVE